MNDDTMLPPFPSREELRLRGYEPATLDKYDGWRQAHQEAQALASELPEVFGNPPRPKITLHVARGLDDEWNLSEERCLELSALDPEQHWTEVADEAIVSFQEYFTFSDAEGWRFYLPAFLRQYLKEFPLGRRDAVYEACVNRSHFDLLNPEQIAFVERFWELCQRHQDSPWKPGCQARTGQHF